MSVALKVIAILIFVASFLLIGVGVLAAFAEPPRNAGAVAEASVPLLAAMAIAVVLWTLANINDNLARIARNTKPRL